VTVWALSDSHFRHAMVAEKRGFESRDAHDEHIIASVNRLVKPDDILWHMGDVGLGKDEEILEYAARLNGRKQLITGNHDRSWPGDRDSRKVQKRWLEVFESVQAFARTRFSGVPVLLSHFPYHGDHTVNERHTQYRLRDEGAWLLHGHTHSSDKGGKDHMIHVGLDAWGLKPVSEGEIASMIAKAS